MPNVGDVFKSDQFMIVVQKDRKSLISAFALLVVGGTYPQLPRRELAMRGKAGLKIFLNRESLGLLLEMWDASDLAAGDQSPIWCSGELRISAKHHKACHACAMELALEYIDEDID
jgi:hypothetical protein